MYFSVALVSATVIASASGAIAATVTLFASANCTGTNLGVNTANPNTCLTFGSGSVESVSYSGVPNQIAFFVPGGGHDNCDNGPKLVLGRGSGCGTAPAGSNWESVAVF